MPVVEGKDYRVLCEHEGQDATVLVVDQEYGDSSRVVVTAETHMQPKVGLNDRRKPVYGATEAVPALRFRSDQRLDTGSGRAHAVHQAIFEYCRSRGYRIQDESEFEIYAVYHAENHSRATADALRQQVVANPEFGSALAQARFEAEQAHQSWVPILDMLRNLRQLAEQAFEAELETTRGRLKRCADRVLAGLDVPAHVTPEDLERVARPNTRRLVKRDRYRHEVAADYVPSVEELAVVYERIVSATHAGPMGEGKEEADAM